MHFAGLQKPHLYASSGDSLDGVLAEANDAGPLLLNLMVSYLTEESSSKPAPDESWVDIAQQRQGRWQHAQGYVYALLLGVSSLLKVSTTSQACCAPQDSKLRAADVPAIRLH